MTAHDHRTLVPGCYRCELDKYEVMNALAKSRWVVAEDCFDVGRHVVADLPAMRPGDSVRLTLREDGTFDVVPLVMVSGPPVILWGRAYSDGSGPVVFEHDALEQGHD